MSKEYLSVLENIKENKEFLEDKELSELVKEELKILEIKKSDLEIVIK